MILQPRWHLCLPWAQWQCKVQSSFAKSHHKPSCAWQCRPLCKVTDLKEVLKVHPAWGLNACLLSWQTIKRWYMIKKKNMIKIIYPCAHHGLNVRAARSNVPTPSASTPQPVFHPALSFPCVCILGTQGWLLRTSDSPLIPYTPTSHPCCFFHLVTPQPNQGSPLWKYLLVEMGKISGANTESVYSGMMTCSLYKYKILVKKPSLSCCLVFF